MSRSLEFSRNSIQFSLLAECYADNVICLIKRMTIATMSEDLPDLDVAKEFYAKYEIKEVLGK